MFFHPLYRTDHRALNRGGYFDSAPDHDPEPEEAGDTELLCSPSGGGVRQEAGKGWAPQSHIAGAAVPVISLLSGPCDQPAPPTAVA
jgi:hypothetical protein